MRVKDPERETIVPEIVAASATANLQSYFVKMPHPEYLIELAADPVGPNWNIVLPPNTLERVASTSDAPVEKKLSKVNSQSLRPSGNLSRVCCPKEVVSGASADCDSVMVETSADIGLQTLSTSRYKEPLRPTTLLIAISPFGGQSA